MCRNDEEKLKTGKSKNMSKTKNVNKINIGQLNQLDEVCQLVQQTLQLNYY